MRYSKGTGTRHDITEANICPRGTIVEDILKDIRGSRLHKKYSCPQPSYVVVDSVRRALFTLLVISCVVRQSLACFYYHSFL